MNINIYLAQIPSKDGETSSNLERVLQIIESADPETDLIVFPETCLMGFPSEEDIANISESIDGPSISSVMELVKKKDVSVVVGFAESAEGKFFNTTVLISPVGVVLKYRKTHLWSTDVGVFSPGDQLTTTVWKGIRVGILICFDIEFPENARALAAQGAQLLIVTDANMDPYGPVHRALVVARAMENQIFVALTNRCGVEGGLSFAGESVIVSPLGRIVAELGREEGGVIAKLDMVEVERSRADYDYLKLRRIGLQVGKPKMSGDIVVQDVVPSE